MHSNRFTAAALLLAASTFLPGCGGGGDSVTNPNPKPNTTASVTATQSTGCSTSSNGTVYASVNFQIVNPNNRDVTLTIKKNGAVLSSGSIGVISGAYGWNATMPGKSGDVITVSVTVDGASASVDSPTTRVCG